MGSLNSTIGDIKQVQGLKCLFQKSGPTKTQLMQIGQIGQLLEDQMLHILADLYT